MEETDKSWFDTEIRAALATTAGWFKPKPTDIKRYWEAVQSFDRQEVRFALGSIGSDQPGHFSPGNLRAAAQNRRNAKRRHEEETSSRNHKRIDHTAEDDVAWESSMTECRRLLATNN